MSESGGKAWSIGFRGRIRDKLKSPFLGLCAQLVVPLELEELAAGGRNLVGSAARTGAAWSCPWPRAVDGVQSEGRLPQVRYGGELATKAYSSGFKRDSEPVQLSFIRCSKMFPLPGCLRYVPDKGVI